MEPAPQNRSSMLFALGVVQIVLGGLTAFIALGGAASMLLVSAHRPIAEHQPRAVALMLPMLLYLIPAANLLSTGFGTVRFRRWARLATIVSSWMWLGLLCLMIAGAIVLALLGSRARIGLAEFLPMLILFIPLIGLPITLIALYTRPGVRETFESRG